MFFKTEVRWYRIYASAEEARARIPLNKAEAITVGGKKICIAHTSEGLFAIQDKCPHNGFSLSQGVCTEDNAIVCPLHRYRFDLRTGRAKSGLGDAGRVYPVESRDDGVYLGMEYTKFSLF
ncbi:MAG: Rieske 2Fe-2S domain-containing protein [Bacteroidota bacterium]